MPYEYNPLLKENLQKDNSGEIEREITALQSAVSLLQSQANALQTALNTLKGNKITKCFTAADLANLDDNEIFEWQGASGTVAETAFVNGYFYKKTFLPATVQALILYHNYAYINGVYLADTYYYSHSEDPGLTQYNSTRNIDNKSVVWIGNSTPNVGDLVTISILESSQSFVTITNKEIVDLQFQYTDSNGDVWSLNSSAYSRAITYNYYTNSQGVTINVNWNEFFDNMGFVCSDNGNLYLVRWTNYGSTGAKFDTVVNPEGSATYTQTNTQPGSSYTLPIATPDVLGGVKIGSGLNIDGSGVLSVTGGDGLKVPRCFTDAQIAALTDGDIFEWQGDTTANYTQGYFYKKTSNTITLVHTGDLYLKNTVSYLRGNFSIAPGYYIGVEWTAENVTGSFCNRNSDSTRYYFSFLPAVVGQQALVTNQSDGFGDFIEYVTVAAVNTYGYPSAYSDGVSVTFVRQTPMNSAKFYQFKNTVTNNLAWFAVFQNGNYYNNYACAIIDNGIIYPMGRCNETITVAQNDITETTIIINRVDTQPQQLSVLNNQVKYTLSDNTTKLQLFKVVDTISINYALCCGRITGSGNYFQFLIPCLIPSNAINISLSITNATLFADENQSVLNYSSISDISLIPYVGLCVDVTLSQQGTAWKTYILGIKCNISYSLS